MNLAEVYALGSGAKIGVPYIFEKFFPLPFDKYIIFHPYSKNSKTYDLFPDVLQLLFKQLAAENIKIVQIGDKDERPIPGCVHLMGRTDFGQVAYLVRNCQLLLGADSFPAHFAGHYDKKMVILYANNYIENVRPYWGNKNNQRLMEPDRQGKYLPTFSFNESPKTINFIDPELVAQNVCELLNLPFTRLFKKVWMGEHYLTKIMESTPNQICNNQQFHVKSFIIRADFEFNEANIAEQLKVCPCTILTDRPISIDLIKYFRAQIQSIYYILSEKNDPKFAEQLFSSGVQYQLMSYLSQEQINALKIDYMDYGLINKIETEKPKSIISKDLYYKSGKLTLSQGKIYPSRAAMLENKPLNTMEENIFPVDFQDQTEFWRESAHFMILERV